MSSSGGKLRSEPIPASGEISLRPANFFFMLTASAAVTVRFQADSGTYEAGAVSAGFVRGAVKRWDRASIIGTVGTTVTFYYGDEDVREDFTDFRTQIATIGGTTNVSEAPFATFTTPADVAVATATSSDIAANLARKAIVVGALSSNAPATVNLRVRDQSATTAAGVELQPGTFIRIPTTAALRVRNNDANAQSYWYYEEL